MRSVEKRTPLGEAFDFTKDDLAANRQGRLTARQRSNLVIEKDTGSCSIDLIGLAVAVIALIGMWYFGKQDEYCVVWLCVIGLIGLPFMWYAVVQGERDRWRADMSEESVKSICGRTRLDVIRTEYSLTYELIISKFQCSINKQQFLTLHHGDSYCIYYVPKHKIILSIEAIKDQTGD